LIDFLFFNNKTGINVKKTKGIGDFNEILYEKSSSRLRG